MTGYRIVFALAAALCALCASAQQELRATLFKDADQALAAARTANAELLAPATFAKGKDAYATAETDLARGRNIDRIRGALGDATKAFKAAADAAEIANVTLASLLKTRADAANANASTFATEQWNDAAERFDSAARRLESGDIRGRGHAPTRRKPSIATPSSQRSKLNI